MVDREAIGVCGGVWGDGTQFCLSCFMRPLVTSTGMAFVVRADRSDVIKRPGNWRLGALPTISQVVWGTRLRTHAQTNTHPATTPAAWAPSQHRCALVLWCLFPLSRKHLEDMATLLCSPQQVLAGTTLRRSWQGLVILLTALFILTVAWEQMLLYCVHFMEEASCREWKLVHVRKWL